MRQINKYFSNQDYLVSQLKNGSESAFKHLYELYYSELCNYASNLSSSDEHAEDIVQRTMIKIWEKGTDLNITTSLKAYLFKSVYYLFIDTQRKLNKESTKIEILRQEALTEYVDFSSEEIENIYRLIDIEVDNLPKQCKEVFLLGKKEGMKYKEIAEQLNISIKTVESHMSLALKKLRVKLNLSSNFLCLFLTNLIPRRY